MKKLLFCLSLVLSSQVLANPTYLKCVGFNTGNYGKTFTIISNKTGKALYEMNSILTWPTDDYFGWTDELENFYQLNRISLQLSIFPKNQDKTKDLYQCKITERKI